MSRKSTNKLVDLPLKEDDQLFFDKKLEEIRNVAYDHKLSPTSYIQHPFTKMISGVRLIDNSHQLEVWSENMIYYYSGMLMDRYINRELRLGLYRDAHRNGPNHSLDCIFHPFIYQGNWHLAIFHNLSKEIIFVDCSANKDDKKFFEGDVLSGPGDRDFLKSVGKLKAFINPSKSPIKNDETFKVSHLFTKVAPNNAINVLAVIYGICCTRNIMDYFVGIKGKFNKFDVSLFYTQELATFDRHLIDKISLGEPFFLSLRKSLKRNSAPTTPIQSPFKKPRIEDVFSESSVSKYSNSTTPENWIGNTTLPLKVTKVSILNQIKNTPEFLLDYRRKSPPEKLLLTEIMSEKLLEVMKPDMDGFEEPEVLDNTLDFIQKILSSLYAREKYSECEIMCKDIVNSAVESQKNKRIFDYDEEYFLEDLKIDNKSQLFPVFIHQTQLFILEFNYNKNTEYGNTIINILEIGKKGPSKDVLTNHMLKKLVENYSFYHNRKIVAVNTNKIVVPQNKLFSMIFMMFYVVAYSIKHGKFRLDYAPDQKNLKTFTNSLLSLALCIKKRDIQGRNSSFRDFLLSID